MFNSSTSKIGWTGTAQSFYCLGYRMNNSGIVIWFPSWAWDLLCAFVQIGTATIRVVIFPSSFVRSSARNIAALTKIFMKFDNWGFFKNLPRNSKFYESLRRIFGILHVGLSMFMKGSDWILLRVRNASEKSCRENHKTHFMSNNLSPKVRVVPFMR